MDDDLKILVDEKTIRVEQMMSNHRARFVLEDEQIRLDQVTWGGDRVPVDAEDILEDMWAMARRYCRSETRV